MKLMIRILSLKCLLLVLMILVLGLTVGYISRCTSSLPIPITSKHSSHNNRKPLSFPSNRQGNEDGFNYYQSINDDDHQWNPPAKAESLKQPLQQHKPGGKFAKSGLKSQYSNAKNNRKEDLKEGDDGGERGLDYPFDEDDAPAQGNNLKDKDELEGYGGGDHKEKRLSATGQKGGVKDIVCNIQNGKQKINCKKDTLSDEVYIPFSFIRKYFEVFGKLEEPEEQNGEQESFTWLHSQAKIYQPKGPYNPKGIFTYFENYNVEVRDRVKCISGPEGVPVSTQWDVNGYFYPIQIAQFGLSHFSKYLTEGEPKRTVLEDGDETRGGWFPAENVVTLPNDNNDPSMNHYVQITTPLTGDLSVKLAIGNTKPRMLMLSWQMRLLNGGQYPNVTFTAVVRYESQVFYLHYVTADFLIQSKDNHVFHGIGYRSKSSWQHMIRDLGVDVQKGINTQSSHMKKSKILKISKSKLVLESLSIGSTVPGTLILVDNMTLSTNEHLTQFFQAADWFVSHQDMRGGWPIPVRRKFGSDFYPVLESGWYSAMGQGHALSLLARAYSVSPQNNSQYADACIKAIASVFDHPGSAHGVRAVFMGKYIWYEEYPTEPSSFVLNGFMYSLLGLYDVKAIGVVGAAEKAKELYDDGLISLKAMLPLYDTGSGTMYDLRHFTVPGISPNLARLDYHVTHINQLLTFATFEKDSIFSTTAERWKAYTEGNRASHN